MTIINLGTKTIARERERDKFVVRRNNKADYDRVTIKESNLNVEKTTIARDNEVWDKRWDNWFK